MPYRFAIEDQDFSDLASGRVLYNLPGAAAFPVRLASEVFQRILDKRKSPAPLTLYDPTCGGAYHLTALGFLHGEAINTIIASDIDAIAVSQAQRNLDLLSLPGLAHREGEIKAMIEKFGKESHNAALLSVANLRKRLEAFPTIQTRAFQANALDSAILTKALAGQSIDLVISDIPYGHLSTWQNPAPGVSAPWLMLDALLNVLSKAAYVAIAADKSQKVTHEAYRRVERFQVGKRQVVILQPVE